MRRPAASSKCSICVKVFEYAWQNAIRPLALIAVVAASVAPTRAQSLGYEINSANETVTVFGTSISALEQLSEPSDGVTGFSDATLETVTFPTQANQKPPVLTGLAVAPALGSATPRSRLVYVTDSANSQLWAFDVSSISNGKATASPVTISQETTPVCSTPFFNSPSAIAIATPSTSSAFAYVANGNGTVTIIDLVASKCLAQTESLGTTIAAIATSTTNITQNSGGQFVPSTPDMKQVFVLTSATPALWTIDTSSQKPTSLNLLQDANGDSFTMADPISLAVQDNDADCYFVAIGDKGTGHGARVFLAAVPDTSTGKGCASLGDITAGDALLLQPITFAQISAIGFPPPTPDPVSLTSSVSSITPTGGSGSIFVADTANNDIWEMDCASSIASANTTTQYPCNPGQNTLVNGGQSTPTSVGLTLPQISSGQIQHQLFYVTESTGPAVQYFDIGPNEENNATGSTIEPVLGTLLNSSVVIGGNPTDLTFTAVDPNDPPVAFFSEAYFKSNTPQTSFQGPIWIMPVTSELTILGSTMGNVAAASAPSMSLNFGSYTVNTTSGPVTTNINCAQFGVDYGGNGNPSKTPQTCEAPDSSNVSGGVSSAATGTNGIGGQTSTTNTTGGNSLNIPASTVFTVTVDGCTEATCPSSPGSNDTTLQQQVIAGADCTTLDVTASGNTALTQVAIGQTVTAAVFCLAPLGDQLTGTVSWGDGNSDPTPTIVSATVTPVLGGSYQYEAVTLTFTHPYPAASPTNVAYPVNVTVVTDSTEGSVNAYLANLTPASANVTVSGITVNLSPTPTPPATSIQLQASQTQQFTGAVGYDVNNDGLKWELDINGAQCSSSATCGTICPSAAVCTSTSLQTTTASNSPCATCDYAVYYTAPASSAQVTIKATSLDPNQSAVSANVPITVIAASQFVVSAPSSATAGVQFSFAVTAEDSSGDIATGYKGTVHFTSTDSAAVLPANTTLTNGQGSFAATLETVGTQKITATDTANSAITGNSSGISVSAAAGSHFVVVAPATATVGSPFNFTVTAKDSSGNVATTYAGTVHFTSSDTQAVLPANSTLTNGTGTFSATLKTAGSQTITATDTVNSAIAGGSNSITVTGGTTTTPLTCSAAENPSSVQTGAPVTVTVTCTATANDALAATLNWLDSPAASSSANVTATGGSATITLTHSYTTPGTYSNLIVKVSDSTTTVSAQAPSFTVIAPPAIGTPSVPSLTAGQSATFNLTFTGNGAVSVTFSSFACSGLPSGATCTFSPASLTVPATGTITEQVTVTLAGSTASLFNSPINSLPGDSRPMLLFASLFGLPAFGLVFVSLSARRVGLRKQRAWQSLCLILMIIMLLWTGACSSVQSSNGTSTSSCTGCAAAGTYQVTVTATSVTPAITASTVFALTVAQ